MYLAGNKTKGVELIAKAVKNGAFLDLNNASMQLLYDDPAFSPIRFRHESQQWEHSRCRYSYYPYPVEAISAIS